MPIFFQQDIDETTKLGIWKIEENEAFFLSHVPLHNAITHPHKRLQHLAARYLLKYLYPDFPLALIRIADTRKPFLEDEAYHFSISHCGDFAAVIASTSNRVGIDIEMVSEKIKRIEHKFISSPEKKTLGDQTFINKQFSQPSNEQINLSTLLWSCKEAIFKWYGLGGLDFRGHIEIRTMTELGENKFSSVFAFKKNTDLLLNLDSVFFGDFYLSYVLT